MNKIKREILKGLAVGAPAVWAKPVVDSVVLPAHATTSCSGCVQIDDEPNAWAGLAPGKISELPVYFNSSCSGTNPDDIFLACREGCAFWDVYCGQPSPEPECELLEIIDGWYVYCCGNSDCPP